MAGNAACARASTCAEEKLIYESASLLGEEDAAGLTDTELLDSPEASGCTAPRLSQPLMAGDVSFTENKAGLCAAFCRASVSSQFSAHRSQIPSDSRSGVVSPLSRADARCCRRAHICMSRLVGVSIKSPFSLRRISVVLETMRALAALFFLLTSFIVFRCLQI